MIVWTTNQFVFFTCPAKENWEKGTKHPKPAVLKLKICDDDKDKFVDHLNDPEDGGPTWCPVKFDATTHKDEFGLVEREIISYSGAVQLRWGVRAACDAWERLNAGEEGASMSLCGDANLMVSQ